MSPLPTGGLSLNFGPFANNNVSFLLTIHYIYICRCSCSPPPRSTLGCPPLPKCPSKTYRKHLAHILCVFLPPLKPGAASFTRSAECSPLSPRPPPPPPRGEAPSSCAAISRPGSSSSSVAEGSAETLSCESVAICGRNNNLTLCLCHLLVLGTHSTFIERRFECNCCAFLARAKRVMTVLFVGFIVDRGTPSSGLFLAIPPAVDEG